MHFQWKKAAA